MYKEQVNTILSSSLKLSKAVAQLPTSPRSGSVLLNNSCNGAGISLYFTTGYKPLVFALAQEAQRLRMTAISKLVFLLNELIFIPPLIYIDSHTF
jgi:hypothetical protein